MTSEPTTFLSVEVEGFRGFRDRQRIALDASAVILTGPNGTGKTSFFDALQWLLLGSLERLEPWRARKSTEHIANIFRGEEPALVIATLRLGDSTVQVQRRGRHTGGLLEWSDANGVLRGEDAERRLAQTLSPRATEPSNLRRLLMTSALLQQDVIREVLEDKPSERYQHLASLLGLNEVREFELAARKRADRFAAAGRSARQELSALDEQHRRARERLAALHAQQEAAPDTARARAGMIERLRPHLGALLLTVELPAAPADALLLQSNIRDIGEQLSRIARDADEFRKRSAATPPPDDEAVETARAAVDEAANAVRDAEATLAQAEAKFAAASRQSEALASLANAALPLLGDQCPVCQQNIVKADVERHLRELIARGGADLPRLDEQRNAARTALDTMRARERAAAAHSRALEQLEAATTQLASERERLVEAVRAAVMRAQAAGVDLLLASELEDLDESALQRTLAALRVLFSGAGDLASVLRALPTGEQLAAAEGELRRLEVLFAAAREQTAAASSREEEARTLQRAATRAATAVAEGRFRLLAPIVGDIFARLDPHPIFTTLDFALDVYYEKGIARPVVRDTELEVEADPLIVLSSAQANVAALSYFLALGWGAGAEAMPFVLLDDPLQSLDDVNALGFADLCRHIRQHRQLIVSTHDRRLASLLERKLAPRTAGERTRLVEFKAWTRRGPELAQRPVEPQLEEGSERRLVAAEAA